MFIFETLLRCIDKASLRYADVFLKVLWLIYLN